MAITRLKAYEEFIEFITSNPSLDDVTNFFLSDESEQAFQTLLQANRTRKLTQAETEELDEFVRLEYIIQQAKVRAFEKLDNASQ